MFKCKIPVGEDRPQDYYKLPRVFACKSLNILYSVFWEMEQYYQNVIS